MADDVLILSIDGDDSTLRAELLRSERLTKASAAKMQKSLGGIGIGAGAATKSVSALGAAAALSGNQFVNVAAQAGVLAIALKEATAASLAFLATPTGLLIAGITTAVVAGAVAWHDYANRVEQVDEAVERFEKSAAAAEERGIKAFQKLGEEIALLTGEKDKIDLLGLDPVLEREVRQRTSRRDELLEEKRATEELVAETELLAKTEADLIRSRSNALAARRGVQLEGAAEDLVDLELSILRSRENSNNLLREAVALKLRTKELTEGEAKALLTQLGAAKALTAALSAPSVGQGRQVSLGLTALGGPAGRDDKIPEKKTASNTDELIKVGKRTNRLLERPQFARAG